MMMVKIWQNDLRVLFLFLSPAMSSFGLNNLAIEI